MTFGNKIQLNDLEKKIYDVISANTDGIKGSAIARELGVDKSIVNSTLANSIALKSLVNQSSTYTWHAISKNRFENETTNNSIAYDKTLHNICYYYLNCITSESSNSVSQFLFSKFETKYCALNSLGINAEKDQNALTLLKKISNNRDKKAYLGYPIRIYTVFGKGGNAFKKIAPLFLFPANYANGKIEIDWTPSINMEILKGYTNNGTEALSVELVKLEAELGMNVQNAEFEIEELVLRLKAIRKWDWAEDINPYNIPAAENLENLDNGIYNRPIVIETECAKYTHGLESELIALSNISEENYRDTALYSWIHGFSENVSTDNIKPILEVLPLNTEQSQALYSALRANLTIITGPPGTGKSQVVTNLLINIIWNDKNALFSSKNNKAVDVVDERVNGLCKRPVLLRIGNNEYASRLAEIVEGLLTTSNNTNNNSDFLFYSTSYNEKLNTLNSLIAEKNRLIELRNYLDDQESKYHSVRHIIDKISIFPNDVDYHALECIAKELLVKFDQTKKEKNDFFSKLAWSFVKKDKFKQFANIVNEYNDYANKFEWSTINVNSDRKDIEYTVTNLDLFLEAIKIEKSYKDSLKVSRDFQTVEKLDKDIWLNKSEQANIAYKLWQTWLTCQTASFSPHEREELSDFVAAIKLAKDIDFAKTPNLRRRFLRVADLMTKYLQCWAVTSLSAKSCVPFTPGLFDYVIIDEASQCDIASILPLLYRAKKAVIIGDPKQLQHISQISRYQDLAYIEKYNIPTAWSYSQNSLYGLALGKIKPENMIQLKDHFRSCSDIIEFSNGYFYDGSLRTATKYNSLKVPNNEKPGIRWIDVIGKTIRPKSGSAYNDEEVTAVIVELKRLVDNEYAGSIGVTTPFRNQARRIMEILDNKYHQLLVDLIKNHEFAVDTVHKFQGDERDIMIFSPVVSQEAQNSTLGFLNSTGNLFNVAITRARAMLIVIGNLDYCGSCEVDYLKKFVKYYRGLGMPKPVPPQKPLGREYPIVDNPEQVSEWEKLFYTVLYDAGIKVRPQHPIDKYRLDFALILENGRKLDIEIDGEMYHRKWNGELCYRDQLRNQRLFELGWDVKRFWVYQVRDDTEWCISQIKDWLNKI